MTYPEKINWLRQYRAAVRREQMLEGELEAMRSAAERMTACLGGVPGAGPDPDRLPRAVERIEDTRKKLEQQIEECVERRFEVLRRRYILGQSYAEIADAMNLVIRRIYQIHRAGVQALDLGAEAKNIS